MNVLQCDRVVDTGRNQYKLSRGRQIAGFAALLLAAVISLSGCGRAPDRQQEMPETARTSEGKASKMTPSVAEGFVRTEEAGHYVDLLMDSGNHIVVELMPELAPVTVANFQKLVGQSFYDGLIFHRIIKGFMIQGGDPTGTGGGGSPETIKGEFASNGVDNTLSHVRGTVSMARTRIPDSASSQFFICHDDSCFLDGDYAAFGRVVYGLEELDRIAGLSTDGQDYPAKPPVMEQVFFVEPLSWEE